MYTNSIKTGEDLIIKFNGMIKRLNGIIDVSQLINNRKHIQEKLKKLKRKEKLYKILKY
jgi:hypothetical protein